MPLTVVQTHPDGPHLALPGAGAWARTSGFPAHLPPPAAGFFNCREKGSQRLLPPLSDITVSGSLCMAGAVGISLFAEDDKDKGPGLTGLCPQAMPVC